MMNVRTWVTRPLARLAARKTQRTTQCILFLADPYDSAARGRMRKALREVTDPPKVICALTPTQAARHLNQDTIDAVLTDLRFWNRLKPQAKCDLLIAAIPIVMLLDDDDIVDPVRALELGAAGYYYKDQLDASFVRRLNQLVHAFTMRSLTPALLSLGTPGQASS
jgi:DNA-binding NarL/FixJ family response regulator